jgi:hypothetical protein
MTSITEQKPIIRNYQLGTCYMCQICLTCSKDLAFDTCECNIVEKPKAPKASKGSKGSKRTFYSRVYDSNNTKLFSQLQISKLKECDEYFGYYSDFDGCFQIYLCVKCHSKLARLKYNNTTKIKKSNSDSRDSTPLPTSSSSQNMTEDSVYSDSDHDDDIIEFNFKLVINPGVGKVKPAKWESFEALSLTEFEDEILELVQNQHDHLIRKNDYIIIYKQSSSHGAGTLLADEKDWRRFLPDYKKILSIKKDLIIIIEIKEKNDKIKRR